MLLRTWKASRGEDVRGAAAAMQVSSVGLAVCLICLAIGAGPTVYLTNPVPGIVMALIGLYFLFAIKVAEQWQKAAVLRLGRYTGLRGPGMFLIIPVIDSVSQYVDQRVRVTDVKAESALTRDTVPVNVDAIIFWLVWNAEKSILEVMNFDQAITMSAQTAMRESIGRHDLAQMITEREMLGKELQRILDEKTNPWGITVQSWRSATFISRKRWKTRCRGRRRPSGNARRASFWARRRRRSRPSSPKHPRCTSTILWPCTSGP